VSLNGESAIILIGYISFAMKTTSTLLFTFTQLVLVNTVGLMQVLWCFRRCLRNDYVH